MEGTPHLHRGDGDGESQIGFLGINVSEDLSWSYRVDVITKAVKQWVLFLWWLRVFALQPPVAIFDITGGHHAIGKKKLIAPMLPQHHGSAFL